ncbi:EPIDERMAL PATTERNING FACTOR-like protein [Rhynchospora pubera]|uniref:Epidermal patterning factor-like protein n=1 Tax=Rhynchospora pubera TaxID=906938 RepID=A0AAV8HPL1_9POAL|nr:EPIDERMAL PATTERNING FACTOR-like protein [Rhynchospora pubera]
MAMAKPRNVGSHFLSAALMIIVFFIATIASIAEGRYQVHAVNRRRQLIGSAPLLCRGRCGRCHPCRPVQVAIQPGTLEPMEYYPIVWRCQCGNKLFLP